MPEETCNVLFLCTGNSARSILAEAILDREGRGRFKAFSAGSQPKGTPNPLALELLRSHGYNTARLRSKSWDEFTGPGAPKIDLVITVCGNAAQETCPIWPGHPLTAHWGLSDPAAVEGALDLQRAAFARTFAELQRRIGLLTTLAPIEFTPQRLALINHD